MYEFLSYAETLQRLHTMTMPRLHSLSSVLKLKIYWLCAY